MQQLSLLIFIIISCFTFGQESSLNRFMLELKNSDYRLLEEKDSSEFHLLHYSMVKPDNGIQLHAHLYLIDSTVEFVSLEMYSHNEQKNFVSKLKSAGFKTLNADVNGNFITTVYDNNQFLANQDYEVIDDPLGKGQIPHYRYRIYRKYGKFDELNGEKTVTLSDNGTNYIGIRENYKNGVLSGERTLYYSNGTIKRKENYQAGRLNGLVSDFDTVGRLIHSSVHSYHWKYGMEKWYDGQGNLIRSLQWQRDVPVGSDRYNIAGRKFTGPTYKNGKMEGLATVPVNMKWNRKYDETNVAIPEEVNWEYSANGNWYFAFETVQFVQGLKTGKAIGISAYSNDTTYIAYYKNGLLDSIFSGYQNADFGYGYKNEPRFTTTFEKGLENGKRTFYVMSGPNKGEISAFETYRNGKLDGESIRYFRKEQDQMIFPTDPSENPSADHPIMYEFGEWIESYYLITFKDGVMDGPFQFQQDSLNYHKGNYKNGRLDGFDETSTVNWSNWIKTTGQYENGLKTGEWITNSVYDSVMIRQNYEKNLKHGTYMKSVNGLWVEQREYSHDTVFELNLFNKELDAISYQMLPKEKTDSVFIKARVSGENSGSTCFYALGTENYAGKDTILATIVYEIQKNPDMDKHLNGVFVSYNFERNKSGYYRNGKQDGLVTIQHHSSCVTEEITYENDSIIGYNYLTCENAKGPYTGTFISAENGEQISVKNGLRHGWCIQYDHDKNEIKRTKYKEGVAKKTIANTKVLAK